VRAEKVIDALEELGWRVESGMWGEERHIRAIRQRDHFRAWLLAHCVQWHSWPGEKPPFGGHYLVALRDVGGQWFDKALWHGGTGYWEMDAAWESNITHWAEVKLPGEGNVMLYRARQQGDEIDAVELRPVVPDHRATRDAEAGKALREWAKKWGYRDELELEAEVRFFHGDDQAAEFAAIVAMATREE
jgi:hypothetical protein